MCSAMYEMEPTEKTYKAEELTETICVSEGFRLYY